MSSSVQLPLRIQRPAKGLAVQWNGTAHDPDRFIVYDRWRNARWPRFVGFCDRADLHYIDFQNEFNAAKRASA